MDENVSNGCVWKKLGIRNPKLWDDLDLLSTPPRPSDPFKAAQLLGPSFVSVLPLYYRFAIQARERSIICRVLVGLKSLKDLTTTMSFGGKGRFSTTNQRRGVFDDDDEDEFDSRSTSMLTKQPSLEDAEEDPLESFM